jgi:hypothetical protein
MDTEWNKAEEVIKIAEQICGEVCVSAVKELRYAGRRLVDANESEKKGDPPAATKSILDDAIFDCYRARHDALDVSVATIAIALDFAVQQLGANAVLKAFPDFTTLRADVFEVQSKISTSRRKRDDRDLIYATIISVDLEELAKTFRRFQSSEKVMISLARTERAQSTFKTVTTVISVIVAVLALVWDVARHDGVPVVVIERAAPSAGPIP